MSSKVVRLALFALYAVIAPIFVSGCSTHPQNLQVVCKTLMCEVTVTYAKGEDQSKTIDNNGD